MLLSYEEYVARSIRMRAMGIREDRDGKRAKERDRDRDRDSFYLGQGQGQG